MSDRQITFNPKEPDKDTYIRIKEMHLQSGALGQFFGAPGNASVNIGGLVVVLVVVAGIIMTLKASDGGQEAWKVITPIVTMVLGFLFGKRS